jgi:tetratricopeptide (TPR) repeat protein
MIFLNARQLIKAGKEKLASDTSKNVHSLESCLDLAYKAMDIEDYPSAIHHLSMAMELNTEDSRPIREMAKLYVINKQWDEAMNCIDYLLFLNPNDGDALSAKELIDVRIYYYSMVKQFPLYS